MLWIIVEYFLLLKRMVSPLCSRIMNIIQSCLAVIYSLLDGSMWDGDAKLRMQTQFSAVPRRWIASDYCHRKMQIRPRNFQCQNLWVILPWRVRWAKKKKYRPGPTSQQAVYAPDENIYFWFPLDYCASNHSFFCWNISQLNWRLFFSFFFYFEKCKIKITPLNDRFKTTLKRSVKDLNVQLNVLSDWKNGRASLGSQISLITTGDRQHLTRHQCKFGTSQVGFNSKL